MSLFERLESLDKVSDIRQLTRLLEKRAMPGAANAASTAATPAPGGNTLLETSWIP